MIRAYKSDKKRTILYALRTQMGFSMREMAAELEIPAATYQCYEEGTRPTPASVVAKARVSARKAEDFLAGVAERVDKYELMFPLNGRTE